MTIAWAIIIVAVLFLLDKYHLLKKTLMGVGIVALVLTLGAAAWLGWRYLAGRWEEHRNNVRLIKERAHFAQTHECLNLYTGQLHPVKESASPADAHQTRQHINARPTDCQTATKPKVGDNAVDVTEWVPIPQGATIGDDSVAIRQEFADEQWCDADQVIHERGSAIDPWMLWTQPPRMPPGKYYFSDGEKTADGNDWATPAKLCMESGGAGRCYLSKVKDYNYGNDASAKEITLPGGSKLLLFTANNYTTGNTSSTTVALLANRDGQLSNLLPEITNSDEYRFWTLPEVSNMPVFVSSSYFWDMSDPTECHACPHRVQIASYVYNKDANCYVEYDEFRTPTKHLWPPYEKSVLESEKTEIVANIKKAIAAETARHLAVK